MSCCSGSSSKASLKIELKIVKKENNDLRTQLLSNFGDLHTSQSKLDEVQTKLEILQKHSRKIHKERLNYKKTLKKLIRENRRYKSRYNHESTKSRDKSHVLEKELEISCSSEYTL